MGSLSLPQNSLKGLKVRMTVRELHPETAELLLRIFHRQKTAWPQPGALLEDVFFQDVVSQGMAPLLYRRLAAERAASRPHSLFLRLKETALRQAAVELLLESDLCQLLASFAAVGVAPLLLKGTALSYTLYPEPGLRPRCDTDLLIPEKDREKTAALLKKTGYFPLHEARADYINSQMSYTKKTVQGITCRYDIHWRISNCNRGFSREFTDGKIFEQAEAIPALGENARTLSRVNALIFACFHRAGHFSHSGDRLIWLYDIHLLCQALNEQETAAFLRRVKELNIIALCADAIAVTRSWFNTLLSPNIEALLQEAPEEEASALLLGANRREGIRRHTFLELKGLSTWRERFLYILQNLFPPPRFMLWRYHQKKRIVLPWLYTRRLLEGLLIVVRK